MPALKENTLKTDIEQAAIQSFVPTSNNPWSPTVTPQLQKFATLLKDAIVKYVTTPAFVFNGPLPPGVNPFGPTLITIPHGLGYVPQVNPLELFNISTNRFEVPLEAVMHVEVITTTTITVYGTVGAVARITLW